MDRYSCSISTMGQFLENILKGSEVHAVLPADDGFTIVRRDGCENQFNDLARDIINYGGIDFVAFPISDGSTGYQSVFVLPLSDTGPASSVS